MFEIANVSLLDLPPALWGRNIERPHPGTQIDGHSLDLMGWVLGREAPVIAVEFFSGDSPPAYLPVSLTRPDIRAAFPNVENAELSGFRTNINLGLGNATISVRAVLTNQNRVPFATIETRRLWTQDSFAVGVPFVSVIIPEQPEPLLLAAIDSVIAQTYPHFELLVAARRSEAVEPLVRKFPGVRCIQPPPGTPEPPLLAAVRHGNGSYVVILTPGDRLTPDSLEKSLKALKEHPHAAAVCGRIQFLNSAGLENAALCKRALEPSTADTPHCSQLLFRRTPLEAAWQRLVAAGPLDANTFYATALSEFPFHQHESTVADGANNSVTELGEIPVRQEFARAQAT